MEALTLVLVILLTAILTVYNRRQAKALDGVYATIADFAAMQMRDRRESRQIDVTPLRWLEGLVNPHTENALTLLGEGGRSHTNAQALEINAEDGRRLVVSTLDKKQLLNLTRQQAKGGSGAAGRVADMAARPLLGKSRYGMKVIEVSMVNVSEWFDLEAEAVAKSLGLDWGQPRRLWFYVLAR